MFGHILLLGKADFHTQELCQWTVDWILENDIPIETTVYLCESIDMASKSLQQPIEEGNPPSIVILDHTSFPLSEFSNLLRDCLPECWILDLMPRDSEIPVNPSSFVVHKPVSQKDWRDVLVHIFKNAHTPQWSNAIS